MRRTLSSLCAALLLSACSFVVDVNDASYRVSVRPVAPTQTFTPPATPAAPTPTVTPTATPTPENALPTPTADGGVTPSTPDADKACLGYVQVAHLMRAQPDPNATILYHMDPGYRFDILKFYVYEDVVNEWVYARGPVRQGGVHEGWIKRTTTMVVGADETFDLCWDVETIYHSNPPPTPAPPPTALPFTPTPTSEFWPDECVLYNPNTASSMRIRAGYSTTATIVGALDAGARALVGHLFSPNGTDDWAFITYRGITGWAAIRIGGVTYTRLEGDCSRISRADPRLEAVRGGGFHVLPGEGASSVVAYANQIDIIKCLDNSWHICNAVKAANPNVVTVARTLTTNYGQVDCPQNWNWSDPSMWWGAIKDRLPSGYDYYEVINECWLPPQGAAHLAWWSIEMAKLVQRDKGGGLLAFSFSAGSPDYPDWPALSAYMKWADENPLPNGSRHGIALHGAAYAPWRRADSPWIGNPHLNPDRFYLFARDVILANAKIDVALLRVPIVWSEIGVTDGYGTGVIGGPERYSCEEKTAAYKETVRRLADRGAITWWNLGRISIWTSDHDCLQQILS